jgi:hypothetical protein
MVCPSDKNMACFTVCIREKRSYLRKNLDTFFSLQTLKKTF